MTNCETRIDLRSHGYAYGYHIRSHIRMRQRAKPLYYHMQGRVQCTCTEIHSDKVILHRDTCGS